MSNVKAGDLAVLVSSAIEPNIGALVDVLDKERCDPGEWRCRTITNCVASNSWGGNRVPAPPGTVVWALDCHLRPINPPPGSVTTEEVRDLFQPQEVVYVETRKEKA